MNLRANDPEDTFRKSSFYEQLTEHVFISEILQESYYGSGMTVEVLRSEIDASGYDLVLERDGVVRHEQLKTSRTQSMAAVQKIHTALESKPSGCVVWIIRDEDPDWRRMRLSYRFFGGGPGEPLPSLSLYKVAKHTKGNSAGVKMERPAIRVVPKSRFRAIATTKELVEVLFGVSAGHAEI